MLKSSLFMLASNLARFLTNGLLFILFARIWGPELFGAFAYAFTIASILVLLSDYGFSLQLVRDIGRAPEQVADLVNNALSAKLILCLITLGLTLITSLYLDHSVLIWILVLAAIFGSLGLFFNLAFRGLNHFHKETQVTLIGNVFLFGLVVILLLLGSGPIVVSFGFLVARFIYFLLSLRSYYQFIKIRFSLNTTKTLRGILLMGLPFGVQTALGALYFQVDTLIVESFMGAEGVGIYQAGIRILIAAMILADVIANVYLVSLSKESKSGLPDLGKQMTRHLLTIGLAGGAILSLAAPWVVQVLYGNSAEYREVIQLLLYFSLVLVIRYALYSYATVLTVLHRQTIRAIAGGIALIINISASIILIPQLGLVGAALSVITANFALYVFYVFFAWWEIRSFLVDVRSLLLMILTIIVYLLAFNIEPRPLLSVIIAFIAMLIGFKVKELKLIFLGISRYFHQSALR